MVFAACVVFFCYVRSGNVIGDAYGPLIGLFIGVPLSFVAVFFSGSITALYVAEFFKSLRVWEMAALLLPAVFASISSVWVTGLLLLTARTHGSGC